MAQPQLRVIDTGVSEGRLNIAFGQALVDAHSVGEAPDTLRFLRFPPTAIIGRHQMLSAEVKLDYCCKNNIGLARRITGGGAIYLDEGQLGWELAISRARLPVRGLGEVTALICEAAAQGLSCLGVDVLYRPRNDLEVDGRKISGTGGFFDGDTLFFQGTVLVDMDPARMMAALNVPAAKLKKRNLVSAAQRIVTLRELLGDVTPDLQTIQGALTAGICAGLELEPRVASFTDAEARLAAEYFDEEIGQDEFVYELNEPGEGENVFIGSSQSPGGAISAYVRTEGAKGERIREVIFTGDFFVTPPRVIMDLESALRRVPLADVRDSVSKFFADASVDMISASPGDFASAMENAVKESGQ